MKRRPGFRWLTACAVLFGLGAAAPAPAPKEAWKADIADENKDYAAVPHAMLKIQDAAYLGDGQSAVLTGKPGQPGSWHWVMGSKARGPLTVALTRGKLAVMQNGKPLDPRLIAKSIPVDTDVDIAGQPTQVGAGVQ